MLQPRLQTGLGTCVASFDHHQHCFLPGGLVTNSLSATYLIRANPVLTNAQKPRTETEEKARSSERAKEAVR
jgi:hypothetical protein